VARVRAPGGGGAREVEEGSLEFAVVGPVGLLSRPLVVLVRWEILPENTSGRYIRISV
jgi:hypothetical protein